MRLCIISRGRPQNVTPMHDLGWTGTWYVGEGEGQDYKAAGARRVIEAGGLVEARNRALDDAFADDDVCVQVSDDCLRIERYAGGTARVDGSVRELLDEAMVHLTANCRLVGVAPTGNAFYASFKVKRQHFIVGDFFVAAPSPIRFDPRLPLKEDYDYTAHHLRVFGEVARLDWWLLGFKHRQNSGGAVAYRTPELEQEAIGVLQEKWGSWIRPNPRRPNEVLLRVR